jgi:hypothetical protein
MPLPTWDEYLAQATVHLADLRRAAEYGLSPPPAPERPPGPMPEERRAAAQRVAMGYDQLAVEVTNRMSTMAQRRTPSSDGNPHRELRPAHFIDTPA